MPNYAIRDGSKIINVIVAESAGIAEEATGLSAIETEGEPWIDWTLYDGSWRRPQPFPSWSWDGDDWQAPYSQPGPAYYWDEESLSWIKPEITQPFPSWIQDESGDWIAPVPYPEDGQLYFWDEDTQSWIQPEE